jgi:hypothetical protein
MKIFTAIAVCLLSPDMVKADISGLCPPRKRKRISFEAGACRWQILVSPVIR